MLEGITVLNQSTGPIGITFVMIGLIIVGLIVVVKIFPYAIDHCDSDFAIALVGLIGTILIIVGAVVTISFGSDLGVTKYEVTISDEVNFKDFEERYEIVDKNGEIYTIIEKDN